MSVSMRVFTSALFFFYCLNGYANDCATLVGRLLEFGGDYLISSNNPRLKNPEGSCSVICVLNSLQALRVAGGAAPISDLYTFANHLRESDPETKSNVTLTTVSNMVKKLKPFFLPFKNLNSSILSLNIGEGPQHSKIELTDSILIDVLQIESKRIKILLVLLLDEKYNQLAGHYVVLSDFSKALGRVKILDSNYTNEIELDVSPIVANGKNTFYFKRLEGSDYLGDFGRNIVLHSVITLEMNEPIDNMGVRP